MVAMRVDLGWRSNVEASVKGADFGKKIKRWGINNNKEKKVSVVNDDDWLVASELNWEGEGNNWWCLKVSSTMVEG